MTNPISHPDLSKIVDNEALLTDWAEDTRTDQSADSSVNEDSFQKLLQLKKGFHFDKNFDAEKEIEEALAEKYGSFD